MLLPLSTLFFRALLKGRIWVIVSLLILSLAAIVGFQKLDLMDSVGARFESLIKGQDSSDENSLSLRRNLIEEALQDFSSQPVIGIGTDSFVQRHGYVTHNSYLQYLAENGLVGLLFFVCPLILIILLGGRFSTFLWRRGPGTARVPFIFAACCMVMNITFVNILFSPFFFVILGLAFNRNWER